MKTAESIYKQHRLKAQESDPDNEKSRNANLNKKVPQWMIDAMEEYAAQPLVSLADVNPNFLHNHPKMEHELHVPIGHVIIDVQDWNKAKELYQQSALRDINMRELLLFYQDCERFNSDTSVQDVITTYIEYHDPNRVIGSCDYAHHKWQIERWGRCKYCYKKLATNKDIAQP